MLVVRTDHHGAVAVVAAEGEVDIHTAHSLRNALSEVIADGATQVVADLSAVTFMDSTGLGVLIGRLKELRMRGGMLRIVATDRILRIFQVTGVDTVLPIHDDLDAAVSGFAPSTL